MHWKKGIGDHLRNERNQFPEMLSLFVRIIHEDLTNTVVVVPLLKKFLFVCNRIPFNQILKLGEVGCEEDTATHVYLGCT